MIGFLRQWIEHRRAIRRRWQADARRLAATDPVGACGAGEGLCRTATWPSEANQSRSSSMASWTKSAPIYATLAEVEGEDGLQLIWSRPNRD